MKYTYDYEAKVWGEGSIRLCWDRKYRGIGIAILWKPAWEFEIQNPFGVISCYTHEGGLW